MHMTRSRPRVPCTDMPIWGGVVPHKRISTSYLCPCMYVYGNCKLHGNYRNKEGVLVLFLSRWGKMIRVCGSRRLLQLVATGGDACGSFYPHAAGGLDWFGWNNPRVQHRHTEEKDTLPFLLQTVRFIFVEPAVGKKRTNLVSRNSEFQLYTSILGFKFSFKNIAHKFAIITNFQSPVLLLLKTIKRRERDIDHGHHRHVSLFSLTMVIQDVYFFHHSLSSPAILYTTLPCCVNPGGFCVFRLVTDLLSGEKLRSPRTVIENDAILGWYRRGDPPTFTFFSPNLVFKSGFVNTECVD